MAFVHQLHALQATEQITEQIGYWGLTAQESWIKLAFFETISTLCLLLSVRVTAFHQRGRK